VAFYSYVGRVLPGQPHFLLQLDTALVASDMGTLSQELFYQLAYHSFASFPLLRLSSGCPVAAAINLARSPTDSTGYVCVCRWSSSSLTCAALSCR
jgi:hypothetical protein